MEGHDGRAYAWGDTGYVVTRDAVTALNAPPGFSVAVAVSDKNHLKLVAGNGVFDSTDGGAVWYKVGDTGWLGNNATVAFESGDLDHLLLGRACGGPIDFSRDGGRTWARSTGPAAAGGLLLAPDGQVAWSFGPSFYRSTDGGATFAKVATPVSTGNGDVVLLRAQPDTDVLVFAGRDDDVHSRFILRFDTKSYQWTKQTLPIDPGHWIPGGFSRSELVTAGTFVPGEASVLCLGITRFSPWLEEVLSPPAGSVCSCDATSSRSCR